jgi:TolA-binding protein
VDSCFPGETARSIAPMRRQTPPLLVLLLALSACPADPARHLEKARELSFQRQPEEALREYEEVLSLLAKKDGSKARALLVPALKGAGDLCYLELKKVQRAVELYQTLVRRFPDVPEALDARANLADILRSAGDRRGAVAELSSIVQSFPDAPEVDRYLYAAAKDYFDLGDYNQAIVEARALQRRYPESIHVADSQMLIATALSLQGDPEKAIEAYSELIDRWPDSELASRARFEQAKVLAELEREQEAVEVLVEALRTHPSPKTIQLEIARMRKRLAVRRLPEKPAQSAFWPAQRLNAGGHTKPN